MAMRWTRDDVIRHCAVCAAMGNWIDLSYCDLSGLDLSGMDLRGSNLRGSDLRYSDLSGCDLSGCDLRFSNMSGSDMSGIYVHGADMRGTDLTGSIGIVCLHVHDPRGYRPIAVDHGAHWMIGSGCRWMSATDALSHWGNPDYHTPELGQAHCRAIRELPQK